MPGQVLKTKGSRKVCLSANIGRKVLAITMGLGLRDAPWELKALSSLSEVFHHKQLNHLLTQEDKISSLFYIQWAKPSADVN